MDWPLPDAVDKILTSTDNCYIVLYASWRTRR